MSEILECERCTSSVDVQVIRVDGEDLIFCKECRAAIFTRKNKVGRPSTGITKKVSLTLTADDWIQLDQRANDNKSKYLRQLVVKDLNKDPETKDKIYFKSDYHKNQTAKILAAFNNKNNDVYYTMFAYISGATSKADLVIQAIDFNENEIDGTKLKRLFSKASTSEKTLIQFALETFCGGSYMGKSTSLKKLFESMDAENSKVIRQVIENFYS